MPSDYERDRENIIRAKLQGQMRIINSGKWHWVHDRDKPHPFLSPRNEVLIRCLCGEFQTIGDGQETAVAAKLHSQNCWLHAELLRGSLPDMDIPSPPLFWKHQQDSNPVYRRV